MLWANKNKVRTTFLRFQLILTLFYLADKKSFHSNPPFLERKSPSWESKLCYGILYWGDRFAGKLVSLLSQRNSFYMGTCFAGRLVSQGNSLHSFRKETRFTRKLVSQVTSLKLLSLYLWRNILLVTQKLVRLNHFAI